MFSPANNLIAMFSFSLYKGYPVQKRRDEYCNTVLNNTGCVLYARLGNGSVIVNGTSKRGMMMGCYCENDLTVARNVPKVPVDNVDFNHSDDLFAIN